MELRLTNREWVIARMLGGGHTNKEVARSLYLTEDTVKSYFKRALFKLRKRGHFISGSFDVCLLIERGGLEWEMRNAVE